MEKKKYESPEFKFEELKLMERVADTCWGLGNAYLDVDGDGQVSAGDLQIDLGGGCSGNAAAEAINDWFVQNGMENPNYTANVCNTKEPGFIVPQS